jgi:hypothetical protein
MSTLLKPEEKLQQGPAREFLDRFPPSQRGWLGSEFNIAVRDGARTVEEVLVAVRSKTLARLDDLQLPLKRCELLKAFLIALDEPDAEAYGQYVLTYESLPAGERDKIKLARNEEYKNAYLAGQQPTVKQLDYLRALGCPDVPHNRAEASILIDRWRTRREGKGGAR